MDLGDPRGSVQFSLNLQEPGLVVGESCREERLTRKKVRRGNLGPLDGSGGPVLRPAYPRVRHHTLRLATIFRLVALKYDRCHGAPASSMGMTARSRSVVWVVPGPNPDRDDRPRDGAGPGGQRESPAFPGPGLREPLDREPGGRLSGGSSSPLNTTGPAGVGSSFRALPPGEAGPVPLDGRSERKAPELGDLPRDSLSLLYELERHHGTFEVLLLLYLRGSASKSQMRRWLRPGQEALESSLGSLTRAGLARCDPSGSFPFRKTYRLTARGTALVETPLSSWPRLIAST
jgi:hypothetical protein